jgi:hypothetical protein
LLSRTTGVLKSTTLVIQSYSDAEQAVKLDDKNIKAYFLMGDTLVEIAVNSKDKAKIEMAIEQLRKCKKKMI